MGQLRRGNQDRPAGPAAVLMGLLIDDGVDLDDPAAIDAWMDAFNALPYDERAAIVSDELVDVGSPALTVELPEEDQARDSAGASILLGRARRLVDFVGEGRKLTQTGNVTLADARQLVSVLETGDRVDKTIGGRTFKTKSAAELRELSFIVTVATKARFVRVVKGRMVSTKAGRGLGRDPLADLARVVAALDEVGFVSVRMAGGRYIWTWVAPFFDEMFVPLASLLLTAAHDVAFDEIVDRAFEQFEAEIELGPHWTDARRHDLVEDEVRVAVGVLEAAGLVTWASELDTLPHGTVKRARGTVTLTAAGRWTLYHHLSETLGVPLSVAEPVQFSDLDFVALIAACETTAPDDFAHVMREITAWVDQRGDQAATELAAAARTTSDPAVRNIALAVLGQRFGPDAESHVRSLLDTPTARGGALLWLVDHGHEPADVLIDADPAVFADVLALVLIQRGPADVIEVFEHVGGPDAQLSCLAELWRLPSPAVGHVLDAIGRHHPAARIAKAARKAAMQHATHRANQPG